MPKGTPFPRCENFQLTLDVEIVQQIRPSTALFLYNFQSKRLYGVFAPDGLAERDIIEGAYVKSAGKPYPAQVNTPPSMSDFHFMYLQRDADPRVSYFSSCLPNRFDFSRRKSI